MNKNIVVPTDFSATSENAARYALAYALTTGTNLTLLHVWNINALNALPGAGEFLSRFLEDAENNMQELKQALLRIANREISIDTQVRQGNFINQLIDCCEELENPTVIMGAHVTTQTERIIFGSSTLAAMRHLACPLIVVPNGTGFKSISALGMACDLRTVRESVHTSELKTVLDQFHPALSILHVTTQKHGLLTREEEQGVNWMINELRPFKPAFYHMQHENVDEAIRNFADNNKLDLLIIMPKKHGLFNRLLHKSQSKQMILNTRIPVMSIHE